MKVFSTLKNSAAYKKAKETRNMAMSADGGQEKPMQRTGPITQLKFAGQSNGMLSMADIVAPADENTSESIGHLSGR